MSSSAAAVEAEIHQLAPLRKAILELQAQRAELDETVGRLSGDVYFDREGAVRRIDRMLTKKDVHAVCAALEDEGILNTRYRFGVPRVSWFDPGSKAKVERHVAQLKLALHRRDLVDQALRDKVSAYEKLATAAGAPPSPFDPTPSDAEPDARPWFAVRPKPDEDDDGGGHERETPWHRDR